MLGGDFRLRKSNNDGHIGGSALEVICEPQTGTGTYTAPKK